MLISFEIKGLMKQSYENEASKYVGHLASERTLLVSARTLVATVSFDLTATRLDQVEVTFRPNCLIFTAGAAFAWPWIPHMRTNVSVNKPLNKTALTAKFFCCSYLLRNSR